jgi:hypothetical protein
MTPDDDSSSRAADPAQAMEKGVFVTSGKRCMSAARDRLESFIGATRRAATRAPRVSPNSKFPSLFREIQSCTRATLADRASFGRVAGRKSVKMRFICPSF